MKIKSLTKEQKIKLIMGADFWTNYDLDGRIYKFVVSDGPVGLRQPLDRTTAEQQNCIKSVAYPSFQMLSQTWDSGLAYEMGKSLGNDCIEQNVDRYIARSGCEHKEIADQWSKFRIFFRRPLYCRCVRQGIHKGRSK